MRNCVLPLAKSCKSFVSFETCLQLWFEPLLDQRVGFQLPQLPLLCGLPTKVDGWNPINKGRFGDGGSGFALPTLQ